MLADCLGIKRISRDEGSHTCEDDMFTMMGYMMRVVNQFEYY